MSCIKPEGNKFEDDHTQELAVITLAQSGPSQ